MASTPESTEEAVSATNTTTEGTITIIENDIKTKTPDFDLSRIDALPVELPDKKNDTEPEKKPTVSFFQLFRYASPWDKILILIGSIGAMANGCALPFMTIIFANFIQAFGVFALATRTHPDDLQDAKNTLDDEVRKNVYHFLILGSSAFVASYVQMTCWMIAGENQTKRIRELYYASTMKQNIAWFDKMSTGDITTRISADTSILQEGISEKIGLILQYSTTFVAGFIIGFTKSWKLALVVCCVIPLLAAAGGAMAKALSSSTTKGQDAYAGAGTVAEQALSSIRTVVAFGGEKREIQRYLQQLETAYRSGTKKGLIGGLGLGLIFLILFSTYGLGFWYGSKLVLNGEKTGGQVLNTFFSLIMGAFSLGNAAPHFSAIGNAMGSAAALFAVIDRVPEIDVTSKEGKKLTVSSVKGRIEFKNINFHYPQRPDIPILKNFNLIVESGQTVALVGSSGSGKSTVVSLLERFYDPIDGQISLDDEDIKNINIKSLRSLIGLVGQEPVLFPQSIAQNIRWGGLPDEKEPTLDEIIESCKKSNAHEFIDELPDKYETLVGEKGALLSGGQKQRIAIARALIKDPPILLLDEATSALDTESERLVQDALDAAATNRTTIVIAHRLSTIKNADKIVVMRKGEIIEVGRHEELISNQGMYYELVKAQELKIQHDIEKFKEEADNSSDESVDDVTIDIEEKEKLVQKSLSRVKTNGTIISHKSEEQVRAEEEVAALKKKAPLGRAARLNLPELPYLLIGLLGAIIYGAQMPTFSIVFSNILEVYSHIDDPDRLRRDANFWAGMFVVLGGVTFVGNATRLICFSISSERLTKRLRAMTFKSLMAQEISFFDDEKNGTGVLTSKLAVDASKVQGLTGSLLGTIIEVIVNLAIGMGIAFGNGWKLTLVVIAAVPFVGLAGLLQMRTLAGFGHKTRKAYENSGQVVQQSISNMRTITALNREETFKSLYNQAITEPHKLAVKGSIYSSIGFGLAQCLLYFTWSLAFWYGSRLVMDLEYTLKQMLNVLFAVVFSSMALGQIGSFAPNVASAKVAAISIFEICDRKPAIDVAASEKKDRPTPVTGATSMEHVYFNYPARPDVKILRGLDVAVHAGKTVAIVGPSGCGKSTIISLILRFYDVLAGHVKVENVDVKDWNLEYLRSSMALVGQEPMLFDLSIGENIAYGKEGCSQEEVEEAAKSANIHKFVMSLPNKYYTRVGEKGAQLSGGQKQRVAIARALIRSPKLLLLDEATSALDSESEKVVQDALDHASQGRTTITIAHRLSTIQNADLIVVMKKGQVVEQGKHLDLIRKRGLYYELVNKQTLIKNSEDGKGA